MRVADLGTMLIAVDPGGHPFGAWQAGTHTGVQVFNQPGGPTWNEEAVADPDAVAYVVDRGGGVVVPPMDLPYGRYAVVTDPWAAALSVMHLSDAAVLTGPTAAIALSVTERT